MELLILYFALAVSISFICSILEAVLLSTNMAYISMVKKEKPALGKLLKSHKKNINKSIASILILNTIANTLGAAAVGAQAEVVFGHGYVFYVSIVLTFGILFISEIIPKTIGAIYWKELAPLASRIIQIFIFITYPIILMTLFVTNKISKGKKDIYSLTKDELLENALLSEDEGVIGEHESDVIENVLRMDDIKVKDILTPRSVVFALDENKSIEEILSYKEIYNFSRILVYDSTIDNPTGLVLSKKIFQHALNNGNTHLRDIKKDIFRINENIPVSKALDMLIKKKDHMFLVIDSYDQTEGIVTLEDCIETLLGIEIMDESDKIEDMREFAKQQMKAKRKN